MGAKALPGDGRLKKVTAIRFFACESKERGKNKDSVVNRIPQFTRQPGPPIPTAEIVDLDWDEGVAPNHADNRLIK